jgi:hypothetical protein
MRLSPVSLCLVAAALQGPFLTAQPSELLRNQKGVHLSFQQLAMKGTVVAGPQFANLYLRDEATGTVLQISLDNYPWPREQRFLTSVRILDKDGDYSSSTLVTPLGQSHKGLFATLEGDERVYAQVKNRIFQNPDLVALVEGFRGQLKAFVAGKDSASSRGPGDPDVRAQVDLARAALAYLPDFAEGCKGSVAHEYRGLKGAFSSAQSLSSSSSSSSSLSSSSLPEGARKKAFICSRHVQQREKQACSLLRVRDFLLISDKEARKIASVDVGENLVRIQVKSTRGPAAIVLTLTDDMGSRDSLEYSLRGHAITAKGEILDLACGRLSAKSAEKPRLADLFLFETSRLARHEELVELLGFFGPGLQAQANLKNSELSLGIAVSEFLPSPDELVKLGILRAVPSPARTSPLSSPLKPQAARSGDRASAAADSGGPAAAQRGMGRGIQGDSSSAGPRRGKFAFKAEEPLRASSSLHPPKGQEPPAARPPADQEEKDPFGQRGAAPSGSPSAPWSRGRMIVRVAFGADIHMAWQTLAKRPLSISIDSHQFLPGPEGWMVLDLEEPGGDVKPLGMGLTEDRISALLPRIMEAVEEAGEDQAFTSDSRQAEALGALRSFSQALGEALFGDGAPQGRS